MQTGQSFQAYTKDYPESIQTENQINTGRWTPLQNKIFEEYFEFYQGYSDNWQRLSQHIKTRTPAQVRSHAQKYLEKIERDNNKIGLRPSDLKLAQDNSTSRKTRRMSKNQVSNRSLIDQEPKINGQIQRNIVLVPPPSNFSLQNYPMQKLQLEGNLTKNNVQILIDKNLKKYDDLMSQDKVGSYFQRKKYF